MHTELVGKTDVKTPDGRPRLIRQDNIKTDKKNQLDVTFILFLFY